MNQDILQTKRYGKTIRRHVLEFGLLFFLILATFGVVGMFIGWSATKVSTFIGCSIIFLVGGLAFPGSLYPVWRGWMAFAEKLGAVMTFLILSVMWVCAVVPMALLLRLFGVKIIDRGFRSPGRTSYWEERKQDASSPEKMRRQF